LIYVGGFDRAPPPIEDETTPSVTIGLVHDPVIDPLYELDNEFDQIDYFTEAFDCIGAIYKAHNKLLLECDLVRFVYQLNYQVLSHSLIVGLYIMWGLSEYEAIYMTAMLAGGANLNFHYPYIALLDISLGLDNRLLEAVEEFEATGIIVSSTGHVLSVNIP
jgi:hypothetical protein